MKRTIIDGELEWSIDSERYRDGRRGRGAGTSFPSFNSDSRDWKAIQWERKKRLVDSFINGDLKEKRGG